METNPTQFLSSPTNEEDKKILRTMKGSKSRNQVEVSFTKHSKRSVEIKRRKSNYFRDTDRLNDWLMESAWDFLRPSANTFASRISSTVMAQISRSQCYIKNSAVLGCLLLDRCCEINNSSKSDITFTMNSTCVNCKRKSNRCIRRKSRSKNECIKLKKSGQNQTECESYCFKNCENVQHNAKNAEKGTMRELSDTMLPSYMDCLSEMLQRMTNLEVAGRETLSSITGTDVEIRDGYSSNYIIEQDDSSFIEGQNEYWHRFDQFGRGNMTDIRNACLEKDPLQLCSSQMKSKHFRDQHDYRHHYCWRREVTKRDRSRSHRDCRDRCRNCQKNRFHKVQALRPLIPLPKRISVGRICRRRWNLMWKSTQERWAGRNKSKKKKLTTSPELQRRLFEENADVKTAILKYHGSGTDADVKKLKSTEVNAPFKQEGSAKIKLDIPDIRNQNANKLANVSPSIFLLTEDTREEAVIEKLRSRPIATIVHTSPMEPIRTNTEQFNEESLKNTVRSVVLINRNHMSTSSMSLKRYRSKVRNKMVQTDSVIIAEAETYVNYNPSMNIYVDKSSSSDDVSFYLQEDIDADQDEKSRSSKSTITTDLPRRQISIAATQVTPNSSRKQAAEVMVPIADAENTSNEEVIEIKHMNNPLPAQSEDIAMSDLSQNSSISRQSSNVSNVTQLLARDVSTAITFKELTLEMDTSRYICCRQYETKTHGTYTEYLSLNKRTSTSSFAPKTDIGVSASELILKSCFKGGPTRQFYINTGLSTNGLIERKSFNGGSHYSKRSFTTTVLPERTTISTCTSVLKKTKSAGVNCSLRSQTRRQTPFIQNDSDSDCTWSVNGSLLDALLRSCSSNLAAQVKQVLANSQSNKTETNTSSSVKVYTSQHGRKSFQTAYTTLGQDAATPHYVAAHASKQLPVVSRDKRKSNATNEEFGKRCQWNGRELATGIKSIAEFRAASAVTSRFLFPSPTLKGNASPKCADGTDCVFIYGPPRCFAHPIQNEASARVMPVASSRKCTNFDMYYTMSGNVSVCKPLCETTKAVLDREMLPTPRLRRSYQNSNRIRRGLRYDKFSQNLSKHRVSPKPYEQDKGSKRAPSTVTYRNPLNMSDVFQVEACTMKPSNFKHASCQTYGLMPESTFTMSYSSNHILSPALSLTDICGGWDRNDLKTVYVILSAIEGRIRRLKQNVRLQ